ncbi:adenylate/guanylate cyclase domain-containing protein [Mycolicibacter sp. MYC123]|uniref:Adenylate/guanylate cyclase domain-containing protein n=1 Tax=[Mycobacterium] zoologicum TaxID=2872311 RepID=A0ABU5YKL0_9MYCO|nr:adenylate/guanylate cyclase domain-containing protein [Mycolicibacter sp. MYC123]MEB3050587.1 adenylate/guanylate cyclase domain-containing protein [Mycolicibacter sp. MYC123]
MDLESVGEHAGELEEAGEMAEHVRRRSFFLDDAAAWLNRTTNDDRVVELVRRVRRSLPGDPDFGDPLSTAGEGGPQTAARAADRLMGDRSAASREVSLGALQVWQALTQRVSRVPGNAEATLVFTDLVGFSTWSLQSGDDATLTLLRRVSQAVEPPLLDAGGRIVKRMGDGLMAVFRNPLVAVAAVLQAQEAIATVEVNGHTPRMRVGIHTGRPQRLADDWLGVDVNIAARVMERATKGGIVVSGPTLERIAPEELAELGVVAKRARRQVLAPKTTGVPADLMMYRLKVVDRETPAEG